MTREGWWACPLFKPCKPADLPDGTWYALLLAISVLGWLLWLYWFNWWTLRVQERQDERRDNS